MVYTLIDHKMTSGEWFHCQVLDIFWRHFMVYLTNRFHFAVRLYSDNAQMTSKRGENKEVRYEPQAGSVEKARTLHLTSFLLSVLL